MKSSAAIGAGFWVAGGVQPKKKYNSSLDKVRYACIGVQGKGSSDMADAARTGEVVGICDIDDSRLNKAAASAPSAKKYHDFRKMLEEMEESIDAVTVSTPDHTHAVAALMAMGMNKHCFCQKPLTHSIEEARMMGEVAKERELFTQMGNQGTANSNLRHSAAMIKAGVIGKVKEVHVWTNRPVWPQGAGTAIATEEVPEEVKWDLWIGPRPKRPFSSEIHPFKWRGLWDFGTGALGDMACHTLNMSFMALNLQNPTSVKAVTSGHDRAFYPKWSEIEFEFPELDGRDALTMKWYDGGKVPAALMADLPRQPDNKPKEEWSHYTSAALIVGEKGMFYSPGDYGGESRTTGTVIDGEFTQLRKIDWVEAEYEKSPGHFDELTLAISGERDSQPVSNFADYAGPLTETILLGNLAVWADGAKVNWDANKMEFEADVDDELQAQLKKIVRHEYLNDFSIMEMA